jgi:hypothetical protein
MNQKQKTDDVMKKEEKEKRFCKNVNNNHDNESSSFN